MRGLYLSLLLGGLSFGATADSIEQLRNELEQRQFARAATTGLALLRRDPDDLEALFLTARAFAGNEQPEQAMRHYQRMLEIDPDLPEPLNNLAAIHQQQGDHDKAIELLTRSINTHPAYATAWRNLNTLYRGLASDAYRRALSEQDDIHPSVTGLQLASLSRLHDAEPASPAQQPEQTASGITEQSTTPIPDEPPALAEAPAIDSAPASPDDASIPAELTPALTTTNMPPAPAPSATAASSPASPPTATAEPAAASSMATAASNEADFDEPAVPDEATLAQVVENWAQAWDQKDFDTYIEAYADDYRGRQASRAAWVELRRSRILRPGDIRVQLSNIRVQSRGPSRAVVDFHQAYSSPTYQDKVAKRIVLVRQQGHWKIRRESTLAVL